VRDERASVGRLQGLERESPQRTVGDHVEKTVLLERRIERREKKAVQVRGAAPIAGVTTSERRDESTDATLELESSHRDGMGRNVHTPVGPPNRESDRAVLEDDELHRDGAHGKRFCGAFQRITFGNPAGARLRVAQVQLRPKPLELLAGFGEGRAPDGVAGVRHGEALAVELSDAVVHRALPRLLLGAHRRREVDLPLFERLLQRV